MELLRKLNKLLSKSQRKEYLILLILTFIGMLLEAMGLGILIPTISAILDPEFVDKLTASSESLHFLKSYESNEVVFVFLSLIIFIYLIKTAFLTFLLHRQNKYIFGIIDEISQLLYRKYLYLPYSSYLQKNTSEVSKNIMVETLVFSRYLMALMNVFNEALLLFTIVITLIFIEPLGVLSTALVLGSLGILFFKLTSARSHRYGSEREKYDNTLTKIIMEGYGGLKELTLLGRQKFFTLEFNKNSSAKKVIAAIQVTLTQVPRLFIELFAVLTLIGLIFIMFIQNMEVYQMIARIGVFIAAIFRMIPSYSKITAAIQNLKYNRVSVDLIHKEITSAEAESKDTNNPINIKNKIEVNKVSFSYGSEEPEILSDISLTIEKGLTIGLIGQSGSGKSTLVDLICGLLKPSKGEILIDNTSIEKHLGAWQQKIGYVSQNVFLLDNTITSNIALGVPEDEIDYKRINKVIEEAQLEKYIASLPKGLKTTVGERGLQVSGGQKQRLGLARALYHNPEVLILDETTSALDSTTEQNILNTISNLKKDKTIIFISHSESFLNICDKIYKVENNRITHIDVNLVRTKSKK